jgi:hypothetical protein
MFLYVINCFNETRSTDCRFTPMGCVTFGSLCSIIKQSNNLKLLTEICNIKKNLFIFAVIVYFLYFIKIFLSY